MSYLDEDYQPTPGQLAAADRKTAATHSRLDALLDQIRGTNPGDAVKTLVHDGVRASDQILFLNPEARDNGRAAAVAMCAVAARRIVQLEQQLAEATR